jgi:hypothetical protein
VRLWPHGDSKITGTVTAQAPVMFPKSGLADAMEIANARGEFTAECCDGRYFNDYDGC